MVKPAVVSLVVVSSVVMEFLPCVTTLKTVARNTTPAVVLLHCWVSHKNLVLSL